MNRTQQIEKSIYYRGKYLRFIATLELSLNLYIACHFCGIDHSKIADMQLLILGDERMTISNKAQVFHSIATTYDKKWYNSYVANFGNMNKDLVEVIVNRNIFAHRILEPDSNDLKNNEVASIKFLRFKNSVEYNEYTEDSFEKLMKTMSNLNAHFLKRYEMTLFDLDENGNELS